MFQSFFKKSGPVPVPVATPPVAVCDFTRAANHSMSCYMGDNVALTRLFTGHLIYVDTRDISIAPHILTLGQWEMETTRVWLSLVARLKPGVVFDVGANTGYFGLVASAPQPRKIHFFEANPRLIALLHKTVAVNGLFERSEVVHAAIAAESGKPLQLSIPGAYLGSGSLRPESREQHGRRRDIDSVASVELQSLSLDDHCEKTGDWADLVKIDVEGFEHEVMKGARKLLQRPGLVVVLEYTTRAYPSGFFEELQSVFAFIYAIRGDALVRVGGRDELCRTLPFEMIVLAKNPVAV